MNIAKDRLKATGGPKVKLFKPAWIQTPTPKKATWFRGLTGNMKRELFERNVTAGED